MINEISFSEVYEIILHMDKKISQKIPDKFINFIKQNKKEDYTTNIDYSKNINEQELQRGTRIILSIIYRDYLCEDEKKKKVMQEDNKELIKIENELKEKYNTSNLLKKNNIPIPKKEEIIEYKKENFLKKLLRKIKKILKFNKNL